jgi:hypothetical protein
MPASFALQSLTRLVPLRPCHAERVDQLLAEAGAFARGNRAARVNVGLS